MDEDRHPVRTELAAAAPAGLAMLA